MTTLDPTSMADWQIAEAAEATMKPISQQTEELGILPDEVIPMSRQLAAVSGRADQGKKSVPAANTALHISSFGGGH